MLFTTKLSEEKALTKYFGKNYWVEEVTITDKKIIYAVYNDDIDEDLQLGAIQVPTQENNADMKIEIF